jgi:hypothetical protein
MSTSHKERENNKWGILGFFLKLHKEEKMKYIKKYWETPRWRLEGGSRKCASYSEILEKCWRHTLQAKPARRGKTLTPPHIQSAQRISISH